MLATWTSRPRSSWAPDLSVSLLHRPFLGPSRADQISNRRKSAFSNGSFWLKTDFLVLISVVGYVFEAIDPHTGESVAIKRTSKSGEYVSREFEVLDRLRGCENVVQLLNIYYSKNEEGKVVQNLVFEFCQQNLEEVIQTAKE